MKNIENTTHEEHTPDVAQTPQLKRRRILGAAAGGVGVLLSVQAKTALGTGVCKSPSAMISGNTSPRPGGPQMCSGGRSPGFWRNPQHFSAWKSANPAILKDVDACPTGLGKIGPENIADQGTLVRNIFPSAPVPSHWGLWGVLAFPKDAGINEGDLLWHLVAVYLNSLAFNDYAMTPQQVIDIGDTLLTGGVYCPSGMSCGSNAMLPADFVAYVSQMYDINADVELQMCKKNP
ncbi:MAG: hypothetical protein FHP92_11710 [Denitromonas halophila]|nr:MAG: hypothetical protein FHP92_11710 [Denitromonas halophila]